VVIGTDETVQPGRGSVPRIAFAKRGLPPLFWEEIIPEAISAEDISIKTIGELFNGK